MVKMKIKMEKCPVKNLCYSRTLTIWIQFLKKSCSIQEQQRQGSPTMPSMCAVKRNSCSLTTPPSSIRPLTDCEHTATFTKARHFSDCTPFIAPGCSFHLMLKVSGALIVFCLHCLLVLGYRYRGRPVAHLCNDM